MVLASCCSYFDCNNNLADLNSQSGCSVDSPYRWRIYHLHTSCRFLTAFDRPKMSVLCGVSLSNKKKVWIPQSFKYVNIMTNWNLIS